MEEPLGIPADAYWFHKLNKGQNRAEEVAKTNAFLADYRALVAKENGLSDGEVEIKFINYGSTELVFVVSLPSGKKWTILVGQPCARPGVVQEEFENLTHLAARHKFVVAPMRYFESSTASSQDAPKALYETPYHYQSLCVGSDFSGYGYWTPVPRYHFECFNREQRRVVNACMVARIIELYDQETGCGIASCHFCGGDFMLEKDWNGQNPSYQDTLSKMSFIAARKLVKMPFESYIELLKKELQEVSYGDEAKEHILNESSRDKMELADIEKGIELGMELIKQKENM